MDDKDWMKLYVKQTHERFISIENKLDSLLSIKWQIVGAMVILVPIVSFIFSFAGKKGWI